MLEENTDQTVVLAWQWQQMIIRLRTVMLLDEYTGSIFDVLELTIEGDVGPAVYVCRYDIYERQCHGCRAV